MIGGLLRGALFAGLAWWGWHSIQAVRQAARGADWAGQPPAEGAGTVGGVVDGGIDDGIDDGIGDGEGRSAGLATPVPPASLRPAATGAAEGVQPGLPDFGRGA